MKGLFIKAFIIICALSVAGNSVDASFPINVVRPYDVDLHWAPQPAWTLEFGAIGEFAATVNGYNAHGKKTNVLQIWQDSVDSLAMLRGFPEDTTIGELNAELGGVSDNGIRGHMRPQGTLQLWDMAFSVRYFFPANLSVGLYLPWYNMSLSDVSWCDLTKDITTDDMLVKELLTDNFVKNVADLSRSFGCEGKNQLNIGNSWTKAGIGDLTVLGIWSKNFPQVKPVLKNVQLTGRLGLTVPTGVKTDESILFPIPFGNDGALGVAFGLNVELTWYDWVRGSVQADFWKVFGDKRDRRVKTDLAQTDLVLLGNLPSFTEWGFMRRYTLFLEVGNMAHGFSVGCAYQYLNKGNDSITICSNDYLSQTADSAQSIEEWKLHTVMLDISADFGKKDTPGRTRISFFYKHPFNGTRVVAAKMFGVRMMLDF